MNRDDEETAKLRIHDRMKDQQQISKEIRTKLEMALENVHEQPTEQMQRDNIRTMAAAALKEVLIKLHNEGRIELNLPPPIMIGDVTEAPKGSGKVQVAFHIRAGWLESLPEDVRAEIIAVMSGGRAGRG